MNAAEAITLCRLVKGVCPQQAIDEYTPDGWLMLLEPYRYEDCHEAVKDIASTQPFVAPAEIIAQVRRIRGKRIAEFGPIDPPAGLEDGDYREWFIGVRTRIGNGELTRAKWDAERAALGETGKRELPALEGVLRRVPNE